ncbi:ribonuclease R [[Mycoplasma] mobile]|uniref:Ribonuclease R n=1 Tax=Mycoplasma mobile (strain ATCC 43663 / 163K / NCTC 11711) TaxID=267748 RepID=Q6KI25_MYCM1|nr:ribonuclease R [[Mycoplasma] mobile]AAT27751.1 vacb-like ribonuclease II [Mycoplasma mobile 163K]
MFNKEKVLSLLKEKKYSFIEIVQKIEVPKFKNKDFSNFLFDLVKSGEIFKDRDNNYYMPKFLGEFNGTISINSKGFGFVDFEDDKKDSVFVSKFNLNGSFNGDLVSVKSYCESNEAEKQKCFGVISKIIKRNTQYLVGWSFLENGKMKFKAFDEKYNVTQFLFLDNVTNLKENTLIKVRIVEFNKMSSIVQIVKTIGHLNNPYDEVALVIEESDIVTEFNENTLIESANIPQSISREKEEINNRRDYREKLIVTIDGDDTKDFDDAILVEKKGDNFILSVHIADVSYYVKENSPIDLEALSRGTSIYLADRVIPMLPESLSNGICSLNPNVDRFTMGIEMEIDEKGRTIRSEIFPSIINSKKRLTYKEVNRFYNNEISFDDVPNLNEMLNTSLELSNILQKFKIADGYVDFEIEEPKVILDKDGRVERIDVRERGLSEVLIENFMVRANEEVATFLAKNKIPTLYRIHEKPDNLKISKLNGIIKTLNINAFFQSGNDSLKFSKTLNKLKDQRFDNFIKILILRSMQKAKYSPNNVGHFGLGSKFYLHFTSPIRRYPDLLTHRIIREIIFKNQKDKISSFNAILKRIGEMNSESENKAVELERNVIDIKKAEFYESKIGKNFVGIVVSILPFGFFVEFENKVDVLIHKDNIVDAYKINEEGTKIILKDKTILIGDQVNVTIIGTNRLARKIDAILTENYNHWKTINSKK